MKMSVAAVAIVGLIASPAFTQSYGPSNRSLHVVAPRDDGIASDARAQAERTQRRDVRVRRREPVNNPPTARTDPDPNIQFQLNRFPPGSQW
jgi:hypothetical protein